MWPPAGAKLFRICTSFFVCVFPGMMTGASSAVPPLVSSDLSKVRRTKYDGSSPDKDEDLLEGGRDEDRESCGGGLGGSNDGRSCQPHVLPPEFSACFSTKTREMRWGLWCPHDRQWMQLVKDNYEKHHRRRRQRQGVLPPSQEGCRSPHGTYRTLQYNSLQLISALPAAA